MKKKNALFAPLILTFSLREKELSNHNLMLVIYKKAPKDTGQEYPS
jgi:hypothetical protein